MEPNSGPEVGVRVRPAVDTDAAGLAEVHISGWRAGYAGLVPQDYLDGLDVAERTERWRDILTERTAEAASAAGGKSPAGRSLTLVAHSPSGDLDGFVSLGSSRDPDADPGLVGEVFAIYVRPQRWGTGTGRTLLAAAAQALRAAGFEVATLWVLAGNVRARRFYAAAGWQPDGAEKVDDSRGFPLVEVRYRVILR